LDFNWTLFTVIIQLNIWE